MLAVEVSNKSFLMLGAGTGRGTYIDSDVVFDDYGLPFFTAKRFKGLLRESAVEVLEMLQTANLEKMFAENIAEVTFGSKIKPAGIRIDDLYIKNHREIVKWLDYIKQEHPQFLNKESIMNAFTEVRQQTAINDAGYAKKNSLRTIRVIKPKQSFCGNIEIVNTAKRNEIEALLALACMNLKRAGSGRNRGWGEINCVLSTDDGKDLGGNTLAMINSIDSARESSPWGENTAAKEPQAEQVPDLEPMNFTHKLEYRIINTAPLLFTGPDGDENMVSSLDYIPGTALHGYYANRLIRENGILRQRAHEDKLFNQWFVAGGLHFSNAYPVFKRGDYGDYELYPVPKFIHTDKQKNYLYDLVFDDADDTKALGGYGCIIDNKFYQQQTEKAVNFHLVRNSDFAVADERVEGHIKEGGIYHYEAIKPGQEFYGCIVGAEAELQRFRDLFEQNKQNRIRLGRSANTQYGAAQIEFKSITPNNISLTNSLFGEDEENTQSLERGQIMLYLLAPLSLNNEHGFPATSEDDLIAWLQKALAVPHINIVKSFARMESRQSFLSHWKMHQPEFTCWSAGSSFLLEFKQTTDTSDISADLRARMELLMQAGGGEKRDLGYGQMRFIQYIPEVQDFYRNPYAEEHEKPEEINATAQKIFQSIYKDQLRRMIVATAAERASGYYKDKANRYKLTASLLGRLEKINDSSSDMHDLSKKIEQLREKAAKPLQETWYQKSNIFADLMNTDLSAWCRNKEQWATLEEVTQYLKDPIDINEFCKNYYKDYWRVFFRTIRKLKKKDESSSRGEDHADHTL